MSKSLVIASGNVHKVEEFGSLLNGLGFDILSAKVCGGMPHVVEDGNTFAANSKIKADALRELVASDQWVLADDSGLEVDALGGAPGIYSARYAGPDASDEANRVKLLKELSAVPTGQRTARFQCVLCLIDPDGHTSYFEGSCEGQITTEALGEMGFGYDPVFVPTGYEETFAQLGDEVKSQLSHRAKAVENLRARFV
ncbi:MAG: RdgB/HAM1 family non-canonical purine NTP pyrophosphatase [Verrucomicrobiota bacterium]